MIVVSDTNILSSLAAGDSFPALLRLFARSRICVPPAVRQELQAGLDKGKTYLEPVMEAIKARHIILRLLWVRQLMSQDQVRALIEKMEKVENLTLTQAQRTEIFAPRRRT